MSKLIKKLIKQAKKGVREAVDNAKNKAEETYNNAKDSVKRTLEGIYNDAVDAYKQAKGDIVESWKKPQTFDDYIRILSDPRLMLIIKLKFGDDKVQAITLALVAASKARETYIQASEKIAEMQAKAAEEEEEIEEARVDNTIANAFGVGDPTFNKNREVNHVVGTVKGEPVTNVIT